MNNPFYYTPSEECRKAAEAVRDDVMNHHPEWIDEVQGGKMFGVLVAYDAEGAEQVVLRAYSGQILGRGDWQGYVPAVFDYLEEGGYFKVHEAEIVDINKDIERMEKAPALSLARDALYRVEKQKPVLPPSRQMPENEAEREAYIRLRQFEKGEHRRQKLKWNEEVERCRQDLQTLQDEITALKRKRKQMSDSLQHWLFKNFEMLNARGEKKNLIDIFAEWAVRTGSKCIIPPSGSGECCAPKLLQQAYAIGLKPESIAEFSLVDGEIHWREACQSRCAPILEWMMSGLSVEANPLQEEEQRDSLDILYEDDALIIVDKPAGMLSVPGKSSRRSAWDILRSMRPDLPEIRMVHRLDMQTSGVLMAAKDIMSYRRMQEMFLHHERMHKTYYALLEGKLAMPVGTKGRIDLPLSADYLDRPRQKVDRESGKEAVTLYEVAGERDGHTLLRLRPLTGRTHQLRLHCAHPDGLRMPILGDDLYGHHADRLYLHAYSLAWDDMEVRSPLGLLSVEG